MMFLWHGHFLSRLHHIWEELNKSLGKLSLAEGCISIWTESWMNIQIYWNILRCGASSVGSEARASASNHKKPMETIVNSIRTYRKARQIGVTPIMPTSWSAAAAAAAGQRATFSRVRSLFRKSSFSASLRVSHVPDFLSFLPFPFCSLL